MEPLEQRAARLDQSPFPRHDSARAPPRAIGHRPADAVDPVDRHIPDRRGARAPIAPPAVAYPYGGHIRARVPPPLKQAQRSPDQ